jgi:PKD repeat protein
MMDKYVFNILLIIFLMPFFSNAQTENPCHKTTEGLDFWFAFMENRNYNLNHFVEITMTSPFACNYELRIGKSNTIVKSGTIIPDNPVRIKLDWNLVEATGSESVQDRAIHLTSDKPMNVYALNYDRNSADVALIFPTNALGNEYYAACYTPHVKETATGGYQDGRNSEFLVVATEDNTTVTIAPTKITDKLQPANLPFTIILNRGEIYQVQSMNHSNLVGQGDLTGSYITSNQPIAFFSGALATTVGAGADDCCWDHLYEQIPPVQAWGNRFMAVPLKSRQKDTYRVLAAYDNTVVLVGKNPGFMLKKGEYKEFSLDYNDPRIIESSKPILLVQYSNSQSIDAAYTGNNGDPFMIIVSPLIQTKQNVTFVAYNSTQITNRYFVNIIAKDDAVSFITLDQNPVPFVSLPNSGYSYAQVAITQGNHKLQTSMADKGFIAYVYGFGGVESYGYGVGFNLDIQLNLGFSYASNDTLVLCQGTNTKLEAGAYFDKYLWSTGDTIPFITASTEGLYWVKASTVGGCGLSDSLYIKINDPKMSLGKDTSSCGPNKIMLKATPGFEKYFWQDGSTNRTFTVNKTGNYIVTGTNIFGCIATDTAHVDVFENPEVKIGGDTLFCGIFSTNLKVKITNADSTLWNYPEAAKWTSTPPGLVFNFSSPSEVKIDADKAGYYRVDYSLTTKNGCVATDIFHIGFYNIPESTFDVYSPESTDKCSSYERIVKYTGKISATAEFKWDFGGLMLLETIEPNHLFKISIGANNPLRTIQLTVKDHGCISQPTSKTIGVTPTFSFGADKVHGCDALCVQYNSKITIMDKVSYHWTFGDGAISDIQNPVHCYADTGKYDVSLMVTNVIDGCRNGSTEPEMIKIYKTPVAKLSADPAFCYGDTARFEYLNKKKNSNCIWFTKGNELISNQNTSATYLLKNEISMVGFVVEENGCKCDTFKVLVKRKPNFDFKAVEPEICLPFPVKLRAIPKDPNLQFSWSVDSLSQVKGDSIVHIFSKPGFYAVTLKAFSKLTGCFDQITKPNFIQIYPLPFPAFSQNYKVATLEHPDISFTNQTEGAVSYLWNFGDGETSTEKDPLHQYAKIGEYPVILYATTDFGCVDTLSSSVKIIPFSFYTPNAFRPDSEIPKNRIFLPIQEGIDPENYQFQVFNRGGSTVFETTNPGNGWNGKMPNGTDAGPGVFVWIVKYSDVQGYDHLQKGTVMLVR